MWWARHKRWKRLILPWKMKWKTTFELIFFFGRKDLCVLVAARKIDITFLGLLNWNAKKPPRSWCVRFAFFNFCYNNQGRRNRGSNRPSPRLWQISLPYSNRVGRLCTQHYYLQPPNFQTFLPLWTFAICIFFERSKKIALIDMTLKKNK